MDFFGGGEGWFGRKKVGIMCVFYYFEWKKGKGRGMKTPNKEKSW